ncbi:glycosyl hydrolase family 5 [Geminisphaera colitermitum]|uniref:glycosyl hydrolase family 5 n=1 Tax=Geminisphaera colitermitum TaxID=1148786 RepID=UPI0002EFEFA4|nr:glycosyl hydrolase family 5 [Geminisphaera colitermitum]
MLAAIAPVAAVAADSPAPGIPAFELRPDGTFNIDGAKFYIGHFDAKWVQTRQNALRIESPTTVSATSGVTETRGTLAIKTSPVPLALTQRLAPVAGDARAFTAAWQLNAIDDVPTSEASFQIDLPVGQFAGQTVRLDAKTYPLPNETAKTASLFSASPAPRALIIPTRTGTLTITGNFGVRAQDNRKWSSPNYNFRLKFFDASDAKTTDNNKTLRAATLALQFRWQPFRNDPLSLRFAANRDIRDDVPGDGQGGWTDQGKDNDLSAMKPGRLAAPPLEFDIIDPATNGNRAAIIFGNADQPGLPRAPVTIDLPPPSPTSRSAPWRNLYLLHAAAWLPSAQKSVGTLTLHYTDGTRTRHEVVSGRDVGDWWNPLSAPNAAIAWSAENPAARIGLYASRFAIDAGKTPASLQLEGTGAATWMILAATASPDDIPLFEARLPLVIAPGKDWASYAHSVEIEPGGVFDFSSQVLKNAPAGKHGALIVTPDGHFAFEQTPAERVRFWGVNLCFSANFLSKPDADRLADRLARSGYNTVRFHHFDQSLVRRRGADSWDLDPHKLDQLDYLFAAMKKRGIHINIDLFSNRGFSDAELVSFGFPPGQTGSQTRAPYKGIIPVSDAAVASLEKFTRALLLRKNPYTGLTWAEDPALIGICPVNEDTLVVRLGNPDIRARYEAAFAASRTPPPGETDAQRAVAWNQFIYETHAKSDARLFAILRGMGIGKNALLTGSNYTSPQGLAYVREHYDYVDNHQYWDHPKFPSKPWQPPYAFHQSSATRQLARLPREIMPTRILGKPFTVTEFNYCRPNRHRAEGALLMPAYASLQDWDALYNFQYAQNDKTALEGGHENYFALAADPIGIIADRVGSLLFQRGDIAPAPGVIAYAVRPAEVWSTLIQRFPEHFSRLGLVTRIGSLTGEPAAILAKTSDNNARPAAVVTGIAPALEKPVPARAYTADDTLASRLQRDGVIPDGSIDASATRYISETRQIELRATDGTVKIVTPRSEHFLLTASRQLTGDLVTVKNGSTDAVVQVIALDDAPLASTRRILVTHLTDALPTGLRFAHQDRKLLESWGSLPHLVQRGTATLTLRLSEPDAWRAWAVDATGKRVTEIKLQRDARDPALLVLAAATVTPVGTQLAYELVR